MTQTYEIVSVRKGNPATDVDGAGWHRYVISFGGAESISGYRQGNLKTVTTAIEEIVAGLNERHKGRFSKPGRVHREIKPKKK